MKVFLSWSGDRSKAMAEFLQNWLPDVIQAVEPWISSRNIPQGSRPLPGIADELAGCNFGIICVTPENRRSEWVNFEAGALSKAYDEAVVVPLLLGIDKAQVTGPLSQFQMTVSTEKGEVAKLVSDMNERLGNSSLIPDRLTRSFSQNWPSLNGEFRRILSLDVPGKVHGDDRRSADDLLNEVLLLTRQQERRFAALENSVEVIKGWGDVKNSGWPATIRRPGAWPTRASAGAWPDGNSDTATAKVLEEVPKGARDIKSANKHKIAMAHLAPYEPVSARIVNDGVSVQVANFPEKEESGSLPSTFLNIVNSLADEIGCSVSVTSEDGKAYTHDWPF
jgi:hypothetical protein